MLKHIVLGAAIMLTLGAGAAPAFPPHSRPSNRPYQQLASDWVQLYLRRSATQREILLISNQLRSGMSPNAVQANILSSPEYFRRTGSNINVWASSVVQDVLGRPITPYERSLLTNLSLRSSAYDAALLVLDSRTAWASPPWWWGW